jgi:hypothetical protein
MAGTVFLPPQVREAIRQHIADSLGKAQAGYWSAYEDEDVLTGQLGGLLRISNQTVESYGQDERPTTYEWSIDYKKFRGRGKRATESLIGADGIFELRVKVGSRQEQKSILFQAKKEWTKDPQVLTQAIKMSNWREAAFILNYKPTGFEAYGIDDTVMMRGQRPTSSSRQDLSTFLSDNFLACKIGDTDLSYDAKSKSLTWRDMQGAMIRTSFDLKHRISIRVKASNIPGSVKTIRTKDIHMHRMYAEPADILGVPSYAKEQAKKAYRVLAQTYHPDTLGHLDTLLREIAGRRMQEAVDAFAETKKKR